MKLGSLASERFIADVLFPTAAAAGSFLSRWSNNTRCNGPKGRTWSLMMTSDWKKTKGKRKKGDGCKKWGLLSSFLLLLCIGGSSKLISDPINSSRLHKYNISGGRSHKNPHDENKKVCLGTCHSVSKSLEKSHFTTYISKAYLPRYRKYGTILEEVKHRSFLA